MGNASSAPTKTVADCGYYTARRDDAVLLDAGALVDGYRSVYAQFLHTLAHTLGDKAVRFEAQPSVRAGDETLIEEARTDGGKTTRTVVKETASATWDVKFDAQWRPRKVNEVLNDLAKRGRLHSDLKLAADWQGPLPEAVLATCREWNGGHVPPPYDTKPLASVSDYVEGWGFMGTWELKVPITRDDVVVTKVRSCSRSITQSIANKKADAAAPVVVREIAVIPPEVPANAVTVPITSRP